MSNDSDNLEFITPGWGIKIKLDKVENKTKGGIFLPEDTQNAMKYNVKLGTVVFMGEKCYSNPKFEGARWCEIGDRVYIPPECGFTYREGGKDGYDIKVVNDDEVRIVAKKSEKANEL